MQLRDCIKLDKLKWVYILLGVIIISLTIGGAGMKVVFFRNKRLLQNAGGVERVFVNLSNIFVERGYSMFLLTNENIDAGLFYELSDKVTFHNIGGTKFKGVRYIASKLLNLCPLSISSRDLFACINQRTHTSGKIASFLESVDPDVIILSEPEDLIHVAYNIDYKSKIVLMFHGSPENILNKKSANLDILKRLFHKVSACVVLKENQKKQLEKYYDGSIEVIGNIVPEVEIRHIDKKGSRSMVYMARIEEGKNHEALIKAFAKIADRYKEWSVDFYGSGNQKDIKVLSLMIEKYKVKDQVFYKGVTDNVCGLLCNADIAPFPSKREGFGLALAEAMACGLPPIGFKYAEGVNEMIVDGQNGFLAEDTEDFSGKLSLLMDNADLRLSMGEAAKKSVASYSEKNIISRWVSFLNNL